MNLARVVEVHADGGTTLTLEIDQRILDDMKWAHGEILQVEVSEDNKSLAIKPTGYIHNEPGTT